MKDDALIAFQTYQPCSEVVSQLPVEFEILAQQVEQKVGSLSNMLFWT